MRLSKFLLLFALILSNFLTGCEAEDDTRAVTFVVYNYTERPIFSSSVNGVGAGNAFAGYKNGGGGWVCCGDITIGKPAVIKWTYSRTKKQFEAGVQIEHHETTVTIPPPQTPEASYLELHFYPDHHVELALVKFPGRGKWPAGTKMEELE